MLTDLLPFQKVFRYAAVDIEKNSTEIARRVVPLRQLLLVDILS